MSSFGVFYSHQAQNVDILFDKSDIKLPDIKNFQFCQKSESKRA